MRLGLCCARRARQYNSALITSPIIGRRLSKVRVSAVLSLSRERARAGEMSAAEPSRGDQEEVSVLTRRSLGRHCWSAVPRATRRPRLPGSSSRRRRGCVLSLSAIITGTLSLSLSVTQQQAEEVKQEIEARAKEKQRFRQENLEAASTHIPHPSSPCALYFPTHIHIC